MNKEDLQQIAELMDAKLAPITERLDRMDVRLGGVDARLDHVESDIAGMKGDIATLKDVTRQTRVLIEQQQHSIQLIAEQYGDIAEKLDKANERAAQMDDFSTRLRAVEMAVMRHNAILQNLQKAE